MSSQLPILTGMTDEYWQIWWSSVARK